MLSRTEINGERVFFFFLRVHSTDYVLFIHPVCIPFMLPVFSVNVDI
jgi:hypothetical protein